jgi:hypothetical protein
MGENGAAMFQVGCNSGGRGSKFVSVSYSGGGSEAQHTLSFWAAAGRIPMHKNPTGRIEDLTPKRYV